uniref:Uncharacterized protein n=1 Tax=Caenorhabditis japonica TaxID=281687 RepID=A0A8R1DWZ5_CAEJA
MRPLLLFALLVSVTITIAFNVFRDGVEPEEQFLSVRRAARDASSEDSSDSDEKVTDGSGSGEPVHLRRVVRAVEGSGEEGSGAIEVTSAPIRFARSVDVEGSGSGQFF